MNPRTGQKQPVPRHREIDEALAKHILKFSEMIAQAKAEGKRYKLVCSAEKVGDTVKASVAPQLVDSTSPLYGIMNSSTGLTFRTDVIIDYSITLSEKPGMTGGPVETAYGLFADFVSIASAAK